MTTKFSVAVYVPYKMLRRRGAAGEAIRIIRNGLQREGIRKPRFSQDRYPFGVKEEGYETLPPGIEYVGIGERE